MATVGGLVIDIAVNSGQVAVGMAKVVAGVQSGQQQVNTSLAKLEKAFDKIPKAAASAGAAIGKGLALGVTGAIVALPAVVANITEKMDALGDKAQQVGISAERLQTFRFAMEQLGASTESADAGLAKFNTTLGKARLGDGAAQDFFKQLGLDPAKLASSDTALTAVVQKLANVRDGSTRAALATAGFGRGAGSELASALGQGSAAILEQENRLRNLGGVISNEAVASVGQLKNNFVELKTVFTASLANAIAQNKDEIASLIQTIAAGVPRILEGASALLRFFGVASGGNTISDKKREIAQLQEQIKLNKSAQDTARNPNFAQRLNQKISGTNPQEQAGLLESDTQQKKARISQLEREIKAEQARRKDTAAISFGGDSAAVAVAPVIKNNTPRATTPKAPKVEKSLDIRIGRDVEDAANQELARIEEVKQEAAAAIESAQANIENLKLSVLNATGQTAEAIRVAAEQEKASWEKLYADKKATAEQTAQAIALIEQKASAQIAEEVKKKNTETGSSSESFVAAFSGATQTALEDAILNFKSLNDVALSFGKTLLQVAIRILVIQPLVRELSKLLGEVGTGGGGGGDFLDTILGFGKIILGGGKASGGYVSSDRAYLVGERGPEIFRPSGNGSIINASNSARTFAESDRQQQGQTVISVDARYSQDPETTRRMVFEGIQTAMPQIERNAAAHTINKLSRERI